MKARSAGAPCSDARVATEQRERRGREQRRRREEQAEVGEGRLVRTERAPGGEEQRLRREWWKVCGEGWEVCGGRCVVCGVGCGVWCVVGSLRGAAGLVHGGAARALLPRKSSVGKELRTTSEYRPAGSLASIRASGLRSSGEGEPRSQLIRSAWVSSSALAATAAVAEIAAHGSTSSPAPDCGPSTAAAAAEAAAAAARPRLVLARAGWASSGETRASDRLAKTGNFARSRFSESGHEGTMALLSLTGCPLGSSMMTRSSKIVAARRPHGA